MSDFVVIHTGEVLNHEECERFDMDLQKAAESGARVLVVDCSGTRYMNSRSMGCLIETYMALAQRGAELRLVGADAVVRKSLEMVGILSFANHYESLEAATANLEGVPPRTA